MTPEPDESNGFQAAHAILLLESHQRLTGRALLAPARSIDAAARCLYHAPFVVLSHDAAADPVFTYANLAAQKRFAMPWAEIVGMPSRYSAEPLAREERQRLLEQVTRRGFIDDYRGVRIAGDGRRFEVCDATVWNLTERCGQLLGQAASFARWRELD